MRPSSAFTWLRDSYEDRSLFYKRACPEQVQSCADTPQGLGVTLLRYLARIVNLLLSFGNRDLYLLFEFSGLVNGECA